jgi:hypothetical protein
MNPVEETKWKHGEKQCIQDMSRWGRGWEGAFKMNVFFRVTAMKISTLTFLLLGCRMIMSQHNK